MRESETIEPKSDKFIRRWVARMHVWLSMLLSLCWHLLRFVCKLFICVCAPCMHRYFMPNRIMWQRTWLFDYCTLCYGSFVAIGYAIKMVHCIRCARMFARCTKFARKNHNDQFGTVTFADCTHSSCSSQSKKSLDEMCRFCCGIKIVFSAHIQKRIK